MRKFWKKDVFEERPSLRPEHLTEVENAVLSMVPVQAILEITKLTDYEQLDTFDIAVTHVEAVKLPDIDLDRKRLLDGDDKVELQLLYNMRVSRKNQRREARCKTIVLCRLDDEVYRLTISTSLTLKAMSNRYDMMMFSSTYLYARELIENSGIRAYCDDIISLPKTYDSIDLDSKEYFDDYVEYRNSVLGKKAK